MVDLKVSIKLLRNKVLAHSSCQRTYLEIVPPPQCIICTPVARQWSHAVPMMLARRGSFCPFVIPSETLASENCNFPARKVPAGGVRSKYCQGIPLEPLSQSTVLS